MVNKYSDLKANLSKGKDAKLWVYGRCLWLPGCRFSFYAKMFL